MDLTGKIIAVMPAKSGVSQRSGNQWMSQEYVIEVPGQYPKKCVFGVFGQERISQFNIRMGEDLTVSIDIDAHEFNGRWFNEIRAYNVQRAQVQQPMQQGQNAQQFPPQQPAMQQQQVQQPFPPQQNQQDGQLPF